MAEVDKISAKKRLKEIFQKRVVEASQTFAVAAIGLTAGAVLSGALEGANTYMGEPFPQGTGLLVGIGVTAFGMIRYLHQNRNR